MLPKNKTNDHFLLEPPPPSTLKMEIDQTLKCDIFKNQIGKYGLKMNVTVNIGTSNTNYLKFRVQK